MIPLYLLIIYLSYGCVSVLLYIRIIWLFIRLPVFKSPIYQFMVILGIIDIANYCLNVYMFRLPLCPSFFRFYEEIRPSRWLVPPSMHSLFSTAIFAPVDPRNLHQGMVVRIISYDLYTINDAQVMITVAFSFAGVCLSINLLSFVLIVRFKVVNSRKQTSGQPVNFKQPEIHLFIVSLTMVIFQCLNGSYHVAKYKYRKNAEASAFLFQQLPWISDLNNFLAPWLFLAISSKVRGVIRGTSSSKTKVLSQKVTTLSSTKSKK
uniref:Serpentine receptor class gamma n=1 Tax=Ditylenchus dipsaci TaxID=166011 RepID=A0A915EL32_9BILA